MSWIAYEALPYMFDPDGEIFEEFDIMHNFKDTISIGKMSRNFEYDCEN